MAADLKYRSITISGRICTGTTTLAKKLEEVLGWKRLEGGKLLWEPLRKKLGLAEYETGSRPDEEDLKFDAALKKKLKTESHLILETHLAGFDAQGIKGVFKILLVCENDRGEDQMAVRIDRMVNRNGVTVEEAKKHLEEREKRDLGKWQRLYGQGNPRWDPYNPRYFDLKINTYNHNQQETLRLALRVLGLKR